MDDSKAVLVITLAPVYHIQGEVYAFPAEIAHAVDHFTVSDGYRREGPRQRPFMYSLEVYAVPLNEEDEKHKYFCLEDPACHDQKMVANTATAAT